MGLTRWLYLVAVKESHEQVGLTKWLYLVSVKESYEQVGLTKWLYLVAVKESSSSRVRPATGRDNANTSMASFGGSY